MNLKPIQIQQANDLIKRYGFCSLETQKKLEENGFFESAKVNFCLQSLSLPNGENIVFGTIEYANFLKTDKFIPMPQFEEVWRVLPDEILASDESRYYHKRLTSYGIGFGTDTHNEFFVPTETTITDAACKLWLQLKEKNLL